MEIEMQIRMQKRNMEKNLQKKKLEMLKKILHVRSKVAVVAQHASEILFAVWF